MAKCELCGEPMPQGEEMFKFHGYSGPCPKPPLPPFDRALASDAPSPAPQGWPRSVWVAKVSNYIPAEVVGIYWTKDEAIAHAERDQRLNVQEWELPAPPPAQDRQEDQ